MAPTVQRISEISSLLGEGPHWDVETQSLYYVNILERYIHKYTPSTNQQTKAILDKNASFIIPIEGTVNQFLVSAGQELDVITWDGISTTVSKTETIAEIDDPSLVPTITFNDGKADPTGKLWSGTMDIDVISGSPDAKKGTLYSLGDNKQLKNHVSDISISNGLAWSADLKKFYYIDSAEKRIDQFDFDAKNQSISNRQPLFTLAKHNIEGIPDGQTIDADGNLWVAVFDSSKVIKIDSKKPETLLGIVDIPVKQVTSVAFGGANLDELYVTTARLPMRGESEEFTPEDGALYKVTGLGVKGLPGVRVKL